MLTPDQLLAPLAARRTTEIVVTTMSVVRPWARHSASPLDFASADSAMGHVADLALGLAMAQPGRRVICLNGDGSMLMTLGTLATIVETCVTNLLLIVVNNGGYEITGNQAVAGRGRVDFAGLARAAGFVRTYSFDSAEAYERELDDVLGGDGPVLVDARVEPGSQGPISRGNPDEPAYLHPSLYESARIVRRAL